MGCKSTKPWVQDLIKNQGLKARQQYYFSTYLAVGLSALHIKRNSIPRAALPFRALALGYVPTGLSAPFALSGHFTVLQHNEARQQLMRRNAAKPGQGRERMRGQFAGYIPANRAEKFREAERS